MKKRCKYPVYVNKKKRLCKRIIKNGYYCKQHDKIYLKSYGKCFFCKNECNIFSQACGKCSRTLF